MIYIYRTFYYLFKSLAFILDLCIYILSWIKDGVCFIKDWFNMRETTHKW